MVIVTGDTPASFAVKSQQLDQRRFIEACECRYVAISTVNAMASEIAEAFLAARLLKTPVALSIPLDLIDAEMPPNWTYVPSAARFADPGRVAPDESAVEALADDLMAAKRPILCAGRGAIMAGAIGEMRALGERTGALLGTTLLARGQFSGEPYDLGILGGFASTPTQELMREADFLLGIGAEMGHFTTMSGKLIPKARVARIDLQPLHWAPGAGIPEGRFVQGDAGLTLRRLNAVLEARGFRSDGARTPQTRDILSRTYPLPARANDGADPRRLYLEMSAHVPENAVVTVGLGHFWSFPSMYLDLPDGAEMRIVHQFGAVGQTLGVALGGCVGEPDRKHLMIEGDGSIMMHIQEFDAAIRARLPLVVLIHNDGGLGAEVHKLNLKGYDAGLATFENPDYVGFARAAGGDGVVVRSEEEIGAALAAGFAAKSLFVIDARVSPSTISDAYLRTQFGRTPEVSLYQGRWRRRGDAG